MLGVVLLKTIKLLSVLFMPNYTILYIEDNEANLQLVEMILARRPELTLISAENGSDGIKSATENIPNLIILDLSLPDMDGEMVLQHLKTNQETSAIPVISLSGSKAMDEPSSVAQQKGFFDSLGKPVDIVQLYATIDKALGI